MRVTKHDVQTQADALLRNLNLINHEARVRQGSSLNGYSTTITVKDNETGNYFPISQWIGSIHLGFTKKETRDILYLINNGMWIAYRNMQRTNDYRIGISALD